MGEERDGWWVSIKRGANTFSMILITIWKGNMAQMLLRYSLKSCR